MGTFRVTPFAISDSITKASYGCAYVSPSYREIAYIPTFTNHGDRPGYIGYLLGHEKSVGEYEANYTQPTMNTFFQIGHQDTEPRPKLKIRLPAKFDKTLRVWYKLPSEQAEFWTTIQLFIDGDYVTAEDMDVTDALTYVDFDLSSVDYTGMDDNCIEVRVGTDDTPSDTTTQQQFTYLDYFGMDFVADWAPVHSVVGRQIKLTSSKSSNGSYIVVFNDRADIQKLLEYVQYGVVFDPGSINEAPNCLEAPIFVERVTADGGYRVVLEGPTSNCNLSGPLLSWYTKCDPTSTTAALSFVKVIGGGAGLNWVNPGSLDVREDVGLQTFSYPLASFEETMNTWSTETAHVWCIDAGNLFVRPLYTPGTIPDTEHVDLTPRTPYNYQANGSYVKPTQKQTAGSDLLGANYTAPVLSESTVFEGDTKPAYSGYCLSVTRHDLVSDGIPVTYMSFGGTPTIISNSTSGDITGTFIQTCSVVPAEGSSKFCSSPIYANRQDRVSSTTVNLSFMMEQNLAQDFYVVRPGDIFKYTNANGDTNYAQCISSSYTLSSNAANVEIEAITNTLD